MKSKLFFLASFLNRVFMNKKSIVLSVSFAAIVFDFLFHRTEGTALFLAFSR
jgi:hypothetical protein